MKVSGTKSGGSDRVSGSKSAGASRTSGAKSSKVDSAAPAMQQLGADAVEMSDEASTIEVIKDLVNASPDIRMDQVDRISKQLKNGSYKINYEKLAEAFIREVIKNEIARKPRKKS